MSEQTARGSQSHARGPGPLPSLPQYEVLKYLGGGGMGEIYQARHVLLDRIVVLKWLRSDLPVNPQAEKRFAREMKAVGQVIHPNVVNATDAGIADGRRYLVMEFIDGIDLYALCRCVGPLPIADACEIIRQAALGLGRAHQHGIVHRDIKPTNIMLAADGCVKVLDLGLALLQQNSDSPDHTLTSADSGPFGTYDYMSPEQWDDTHNVDHRTDLYSLGCTFYYLLCGHAPFGTERHSSPASKMRAHVLEDVPPIQDLRPDVPEGLRKLVEGLLVKEPEQRLDSADQLAEGLVPFTSGSDLKNLISSAHGGDASLVNESTTNPESQTIIAGGSDRGPGQKSPPAADGPVTKVSQSATAVVAPGTASPANRAARWLFTGTVAAALFTAGAAAAILFLLNSGHHDTPGNDSITNTSAGQQTAAPDHVVETTESHSQLEPESSTSTLPSDGHDVDEHEEMPIPVVIPVFEQLPLQELRENERATVLVAPSNIQELRGKVAFELLPGAPDGVRIDAETGVIHWQPGESDGGTGKPVEVTVRARSIDPTVGTTETTVAFNVAEVNQPPRLARLNGKPVDAAAGRLSATEGEPFEAVFVLDDSDVPPNPLDLTAMSSLPAGAELTRVDGVERTWKLTWMPDEQHGGFGDVQIRLRADDGVDPTELDPIRIAVAEVNQPPAITSVNGVPFNAETPWKVEVAEGTPLELTVTAADVDLPVNPLTLAAVGELPTGAKLEPVDDQSRTWRLKWTPGEVHGGGEPVAIRLRAEDGSASSDMRSVVVTVGEINAAPVLASINGTDVRERPEYSATAREGRPLELTLVAADSDLPPNPLSIHPVDPLPDGAQLTEVEDSPGTWRFTWTPDEKTGGSGAAVHIPLRVFDGNARSEPRTLVVRVDEVNEAPDFATVGGGPLNDERSFSVAIDEGDTLSVAISGADGDLPKNELTLVAADAAALPEGAMIVADEKDARLWRLVWTPSEAQGGLAPFEISLLIRDSDTTSRQARLLVRVDEVNTRPAIADIEPQSAGPGEEFLLDINVADADLPGQDLSVEFEQPEELDARWTWLPVADGRPETLRFLWRPDAERDIGKRREFTLRVTDNGKPPLSATRTFEVSVGRYITNSIGMNLALIPSGEFRMGNLNPEELEQLIPKAPEIPEPTERQPGVRPPFGNRTPPPGQPAVPFTRPGTPEDRPGTGVEDDSAAPEAEAKPDDVPFRQLPVANAFYMSAHEVTQAQYEAVMSENPSYFSAAGPGRDAVADLDPGEFPVESVTYAQAIEFCRRLSERPEEKERGRAYRLPAEIEWEYACRAGSESLYHSGQRLSSTQANFDGRYPPRGTQPGPYLRRSTTVGSYEPNEFGLYDMHGNVSEWCFDWYAADAYEQDLEWFGPPDGAERVVRGGSYHSQRAHDTRSAVRDSRDPAAGSPRIGFRVVCEIPAPQITGPDDPVPDPQPEE